MFSNSFVVGPSNRNAFVTKLGFAEDIQNEYDVGKTLESLLGDSWGIFPVDALVCGLSRANLGP